MEQVTEEKASWVLVTVTGDPELAKKMKDLLGLILDWAVLTEDQFLKIKLDHHFLKDYDQSTALKSTDRLQFYIMKFLELSKGEKAGFRFE